MGKDSRSASADESVDRRKDLLALLMAGAAVVLLVLTGLRWLQPEPISGPTLPERFSQPIDLASLLSDDTFSYDRIPNGIEEADVVALFVLNAEVCPPCLSEVADYREPLRELAADGITIEPVALVFEEDDAQAERFVRASDLPMPTGWGNPPGLAERLAGADGGAVLQQIVFVDADREIAYFRSLLPNTVTDHDFKRALLRHMLEARSLSPTSR